MLRKLPAFTRPLKGIFSGRSLFTTLLSILFVSIVQVASAQAPGYTFASASGSYSAISGGTQYSSGSGMDDATFSVTLPFTFNFNGTNFTQVYLSENGYVSFGATDPGTTTRSAISSANTGFQLAAALSGDLQGIGVTSELRAQTTGSAPNRIFIVQWTNLQQYLGSGQSYNFQLQLDEANGVIASQVVRFVYGTVSSTSATNTYQVGLRNTTNAGFTNRTTTSNWASTTAGSTNADACTVSSTVAPASGLTYTWTPIGQTYSSSTTTQAVTTPVPPGATNQQIIGVQVVVTGGSATVLNLTNMSLNTTGTTNTADITSAKVFYTGTSATFATTTQVGSTVSSPNGTFSVNPAQALAVGTNYFWVTYDVAAAATVNNVLDAQCTQITVTGTNYTPTVTNPAGSRQIIPPLNGTYTVGTGGYFTTLTAAAAAINGGGVTGAVTFSLISSLYSTSETFPIVFNQILGASAVNTITIKPAAGITPTITGSASSLITLSGTDYITIDGSNSGTTSRDLTLNNTSTGTSTCIWVSSLGTGLGATNNVIKNCNIKGGSTTATGVMGISVQGTTLSTTGTGADNDNVTITNNAVSSAYYGIQARGVASTGMNDNLIISNNVIGSTNSASTVLFAGIDFQNASNPIIQSNYIFNMSQAAGISTNPSAINAGGTITTGYIIGNIINGVRNPSAGGWGAYGINVVGTITTMNIINNDISDISTMNYSTTSTTYNAFGIRITVAGTYNIYNNSINLFGAVPNVGSTAHFSAAMLFIGGTTVDLRNNVLVNTQTGLTGAKSFAIYATIANTAFSANTNRNDYYVSGSNGILGYIGAANQTSLTAWQTAIASSKDANAISSDPLFNGPALLRPTAASPLLNAGATVSGITTDLRGFTRNATTPTIGAYEQGGEFLPPSITFTSLPNTPSTSNPILTGFATITDGSGVNTTAGTRPRLYYKKSTEANAYLGNTSANNGWKWVEASNTSSPFSFTIDYSLLTGGSVTQGDQIQYFVIAQDLAGTPNVAVNTGVTLLNTTVLTSPTSVALTAGAFPASGFSSYFISFQVNGFYSVGAGQQFTSLTNPGGFFDYVNNNVIAGDVVALITSNLTETGAIALNQTSEFGGSNFNITIQPSQSAMRTISGSYAGGLIRLNGADRVTFDGRFNGSGTNNYLTFANNQATGTTGCIQLISLGNGLGAVRNTIRNCNFNMPRATVASGAIFAGGTTINTAGSDNDSLTIINNYVQSAAAGAVIAGNVGFECDVVNVSNNILDTLSQAGLSVANARMVTTNGNRVNNVTGGASVTIYGLAFASNVRNATVSQNIITNMSSSGQNCFGIVLGTSDSNFTISRNTIKRLIHVGTGGYGGKGIELTTGLTNSAISVSNNFIIEMGGDGWSSIGGDANVGIRINGAMGGVRVYHNTVNLYGSYARSGATADLSAAFAVTSASATNIDVRNNIFRNSIINPSGTQASYAIYTASASVFSNINYNDYFVAGTQGVLGYAAAAKATLAAWQVTVTADAYSQNQAVNFVDSTSNLRLAGASVGNFYLRGKPLAGFATDYDNATRSAVAPYQGANEASAALTMTANAGNDTTMCAGSSYTLGGSGGTVTGGVGTYTYSWTSGASAVANPVVSPTTTTSYVVTATDAMNFTAMDTVVVTVNALPAAPSATAPAIVCSGATALLSATGTGTFTWYKNASGGSALATGVTYTTAALTANDSFYVTSTLSGCESTRGKVNVNLTIPAAPAASAAATCSGSTASLSATATGTINWYKNASGGSLLASGANYTTPVLTANDSFHVESVVSGCSSSRTKVNVTINSLPAAPSVATPAAICAGTSTKVIATGTGTKKWYTASTGGSPIYTGDTLTTATLTANATYHVDITNGNGCTSATRTSVTVTVNALPSAPSVTTPAPICAGGSTSIMANTTTGSRSWFTASTGGSSIYTGDTLSTGSITGTTTYYVENNVNSCASATRTAVIVTVNPLPAPPTATPATICAGASASLVANGAGSGDSVMWYDASTNGNLLNVNNVYATGALNATTTFFMDIKSAAGCISSSRSSVVVTVNPIPADPTLSDLTVCEGSTADFDFSSATGTLNWYDASAGGTAMHVGNTLSIPGNLFPDSFFVSTSVLGCESGRSKVMLNVTALPTAPLASNTSVCEGHAATLSATGSSGASFYWFMEAAGGTALDSGATISRSGVTATTVYFVEARNGICANSTRTPVVVVFNSKPNSAFTVVGQIAGQVSFASSGATGVTYLWSFGDGGTSTEAAPTRTYASNNNYNVKLVVTNPTTGCKDSTTQSVNVGTVGFSSRQSNPFAAVAYPNPFAAGTMLSYHLPQADQVSIQVIDVLGREVLATTKELKQAGKHNFGFNASGLKAGAYYIRLHVGDSQHTVRVMKAE